jgi:hypothetical protein
MPIRIRLPLLAFFSLSVLAACGGGGGGDSGTASTGGSTSRGGTTAAPFAFADSNAGSAAGVVLTGLEQIATSGELLLSAAYILTQNGGRTYVCRTSPTSPLTIGLQDLDGNGVPSPGDVITVTAGPCVGFSRDLKITLTAFEGDADKVEGTVELKSDGDNPQLHAEGKFTFSATTSPGVAQWQATNVTVTITAGGNKQTVTIPSAQKTISALAAIASVDASRMSVLSSFAASADARSVAASAPSSSAADAPADGGSTRVIALAAPSAVPPTYTVELSGSLASPSLDAVVTFATPSPLSGLLGVYPTGGELMLTAGASKLRLRPAADPAKRADYADYEIDATGSGQFAPAKQIAWSSLGVRSVFGVPFNSPPVIKSLYIQPSNPIAQSYLSAQYFVTDAENDPIQYSFQWRRNDVVIQNQSQSLLAPGQHQRGDTVSVTMTASDGHLSASQTAAVVIGNTPPRISAARIAPSPAFTDDDLTFQATVTDADNDALQLRYEWRRNGVLIVGATTNVLPASEQAGGDVITATVFANDGIATSSAQESIGIADSPPLVTSNAPSVVSYGSLVTFTVRAVDPDDGATRPSGRFLLTHGPAGMSLNAATGAVTWRPSGPMFDRSLDVSYGVVLDEPNARPFSGTIRVEDPARSYPLMRGNLDAPLERSGLVVGDFDGDGHEEVLVLSSHSLYELGYDGAGYRQTWMYPFTLAQFDSSTYVQEMGSALATADVDGDGKQEIFVGAGNRLVKLDGVERRVAASAPLGAQVRCVDLVVARVTNAGAKEVVCLAQDSSDGSATIKVFAAADLAPIVELPSAQYGDALAVGNVDNDPELEIVTSGGYVFDGATFANQWTYAPGFGNDIAVGDVDGTGVGQIVATTTDALRGYSATAKSPLWALSMAGPLSISSVVVRDIDKSSPAEIIAFTADGYLSAYRYNPATPNAPTLVFRLAGQNVGPTPIGIGDVDGDGALEYVYATGSAELGPDTLVVVGRNGATGVVEWVNDKTKQLDGPFVGGDLIKSPLVAAAPVFGTPSTNSGRGGSRLVTMAPNDGRLQISSEIGIPSQAPVALAAADYDNSGTDEVFMSSSASYGARLLAYDFFADQVKVYGSGVVDAYGSAVAAADLTGDGHADLIGVSSAGAAYAYDVYNQAPIPLQSPAPGPGEQGLQVIVADLDGDAVPEIVTVTSTTIWVYKRVAGPIAYRATWGYGPSQSTYRLRDAIVGDLDGDGSVEIVAVMPASNSADARTQILVIGRDFSVRQFVVPLRASGIAIEPGASPRKNLLLNVVTDFNDPSANRGLLVAIDWQTGNEVWRSPPLIGDISPHSVKYVDPAGTGAPRIAIGTAAGMYLTR